MSPLDGRPMDSRASRFTGFKRPHGPALTRPVLDDEDIQRDGGELAYTESVQENDRGLGVVDEVTLGVAYLLGPTFHISHFTCANS